MSTFPESREAFDAELHELESKFTHSQAELELTVRDSALGLEGYVVVWNPSAGACGPLGPCGKGGTRISPGVTLSEVAMLAQRMALKNAAAGLPMGGAKSGIQGDPDAPGFEQRYRRFVQLVKPLLRENGGPFGGFGFDIGARPEHALWACEEAGSSRCFTGKTLERGGTDYDREGIAGYGVAIAAKAAIEHSGESMQGKTCAVQGAGAMGGAVVRSVTELGARVVAVSDPRLGGMLVAPDGLPEPLVAAIGAQKLEDAARSASELGLRTEPLDQIFRQQADIVFPCALQDVIDESNADDIRAKYVVEGANNPCSPGAQEMLFHRGIVVIPDFIANPGGIIAAFVEMTSDVSDEENARTRRKVEEAKELTRTRIAENVSSVLAAAERLSVSPVSAARLVALRRIVDLNE